MTLERIGVPYSTFVRLSGRPMNGQRGIRSPLAIGRASLSSDSEHTDDTSCKLLEGANGILLYEV